MANPIFIGLAIYVMMPILPGYCVCHTYYTSIRERIENIV